MWSKTTEYAVRALVYVAISNENSHRPGFKEVAEAIGAPVQFTAKILQSMARQKLLLSIRGKGGGFFFARDADELKLSRVINTFQGEDFFEGCVLGIGKCDPSNPCPLHDEFSRIRVDLVRMAESETIQGLARKIEGGQGKLKRV
jgi:Rrf2 family protein